METKLTKAIKSLLESLEIRGLMALTKEEARKFLTEGEWEKFGALSTIAIKVQKELDNDAPHRRGP